MTDRSEISDEARPSSWTRRALVGGGTLVAATAALGAWRAIDTGMVFTDGAAFDPWRVWSRTPPGDPHVLVAAAVLASNPHNIQPWLFRVSDGAIDVIADPKRNLGAMDPFNREKWHGLGAAIANIEIASSARGFDAQVELLPEKANPDLAARIHLRRQPVKTSALADVIDRRRTNRGDYDLKQEFPKNVLDLISGLDDNMVKTVWLSASTDAGRTFARETLDATRTIVADPEMSHDGHQWFRANPREVNRYRDGVATPTSGIPAWLSTLSPLMPPVSAAEAGGYWLRSTERQLSTAPMFGLVVVRDLYDRKTQLLAGMRWQRIHLTLTATGLAAHPMNQLVEVVDRDRQLRRSSPTSQILLTLAGGSALSSTFAFRAGRALVQMPHSARRGAESVTLT